MTGNLMTYDKLQRAFRQLGVVLEIPDQDGMVNFEYDGYPYLLCIIEEEDSFYICDNVTGPTGNISEETFQLALEMTQQQHPDIEGSWSNDFHFLISPTYSLKNSIFLPKTTLGVIIERFYEAHTLMEWNVFMLLDPSAWPGNNHDSWDQWKSDVDFEFPN